MMDGTRNNNHDLTALSGSVFSEAFECAAPEVNVRAFLGECDRREDELWLLLVCWILSIKVVAFWDLRQSTHHDAVIEVDAFFALFVILIVMMVLIDRDWKDDSNGG